MTTPWKPLSRDECRDLTCMLAGAPWPDEMLGELQRLLSIYDGLRDSNQRPVDPATLPRKVAKEVMRTGRLPSQPVEVPARHPVVVHWRNDAIEACAGIADAYGCHDAARDMRVMLTTAAEPSPTSGMNVAQRIAHVGGRNNAAGYVEFGSIQAVEALVRQVLRDLPAPPHPEVEKLRKALVYVAFALHGTPQHMLAPGITLIDGDTVRVSRDGWTVEASTGPHRQPSAPAPAASVATLVARAGLYWDSYKAGYFVRDENDSGEACMARFARLVAESGGDIAAAASTKPCPTCSAPCETTVNPRGGEYGWGTTDAERTTYRYAGVKP